MKNIVHNGKEVEITFHPLSGNMYGKFYDKNGFDINLTGKKDVYAKISKII